MKSELDLFASPQICTNVVGTEQIVYNPITGLDSSSTTIDFLIPGNGDRYLNLNTIYLRLLVQLETTNNDVATIPGPVNNLLHSLFKQVTLYLNGVQVSQDNDYHYKSFLLTLLNYGNDATQTHLETTGWLLEKENFDSLIHTENTVLKKRADKFHSKKTVELFGKVHVDLFSQPKYMLNNVDLKISFTKEKPEFYLMEKVDGTSTIKIIDANLYVDQIHLNPEVLVAHETMLQKINAKYPFKRICLRQFTLNPNSYSLNLDNIVIGHLPNLLIFAMVANEGYTGSRKRNPYFMQNFNLNQIALFKNGQQIPSKPIKLQFDSENGIQTSIAYNTLFKGTGINYFDRGHQVTKDLFDSGYFMLVFDLTQDHAHNKEGANYLCSGSLRIEGNFATPLKEAVTCLVLMEYDSMLEIDQIRNVKTIY